MDVSVIIVNYKTPQLCIDCINSVIEKTVNIDYEIIVVDNDSQDNSLQKIKEEFGNRVVLIDAGENLGFGKANNLGAERAKGDILFFLNPDTLLINDAITILYEYLISHPKVGICGGQLYNKDLQKIHSYSMCLPGIICDVDNATKGKISNIVHLFSRKCHKVGHVTGADLMISKHLFDKLKGFDPDFFMYYEETELCYRCKKKGYEVRFVPDAKIIHLVGQSLEYSPRKVEIIYEGRKTFFTKTTSKYHKYVIDQFYILLCYMAHNIYSLFNKKKSIKYKHNIEIYKKINGC